MAKYSQNEFHFQSALSPEEIVARLRDHTLIKKNLVMVTTNKDFIGRVEASSFAVIDSSMWPYGAACVFKGTITPDSQIVLTSTLHIVFRVLWAIWVLAISIEFLLTMEPRDTESVFSFFILMPISSFLFRLFMHVLYILSRNQGLEKMKRILELVDIKETNSL